MLCAVVGHAAAQQLRFMVHADACAAAAQMGFAAFDLEDPRLVLSQFIDGNAYTNLLSMLENMNPRA